MRSDRDSFDRMDELIEVADVLVDGGLEGIVAALIRLVGLVALLAGVGLWLLTDTGLLVAPAALIACGLFTLLIAPGLFVAALEVV